MSGTQRWRSQSLVGHEFFTGRESKAHDDGHMPRYAELAFRLANACCAVAGMAKKRWRDGDPERMTLQDVRRMRHLAMEAFDDLEASLEAGTDRNSMVHNEKKAEASFVAHGRLGYLALAHMEEAGELAAPLHALAVGAGDPATAKRDIAEEAADVRVYLHVTSESLHINPTTSTDEKWGKVQKRWPHIFSRPRVQAPKVDMEAAVRGLLKNNPIKTRKTP